MKKTFLFILLICTIIPILPYNISAKAPVYYVALGDSITAGTGQKDKSDNFVSRLTSKLKQTIPEIKSYNMGKEGDTIKDTYSKIKTEEFRKKIRKASYISLTTGGNDILDIAAAAAKKVTGKNMRKSKKIPKMMKSDTTAALLLSYLEDDSVKQQVDAFVTEFSEKFHDTITILRQENPNAVIIVQTIYNPASGSEYEYLSKCIDTILPSINAVIADEVYEQNSENLLLLDTYRLFKNHANTYVRILKDDIHPTKKGHEVIATALLYTIEGKSVDTLFPEDSKTVAANEVSATNSENGKKRLLMWCSLGFFIALLSFFGFKIRKYMIR